MPAALAFGAATCTVLWLSTEHDPGLNVTGISEWRTMRTFGSETAHRAQEMHQLILRWKIPRGKVELYSYYTVNQPATDAAAGLTRKRCQARRTMCEFVSMRDSDRE